MFSMQLQWHSFSVNLDNVSAWLKATYPTYVGNSADTGLTLWFNSQPNDYDTAAINSYWTGLTSASPEARGYVTQAALTAAYAAIQTAVLSLQWDSMTPVQRKVVMGLSLTNSELGF